jgi:hypothetical protein
VDKEQEDEDGYIEEGSDESMSEDSDDGNDSSDKGDTNLGRRDKDIEESGSEQEDARRPGSSKRPREAIQVSKVYITRLYPKDYTSNL